MHVKISGVMDCKKEVEVEMLCLLMFHTHPKCFLKLFKADEEWMEDDGRISYDIERLSIVLQYMIEMTNGLLTYK